MITVQLKTASVYFKVLLPYHWRGFSTSSFFICPKLVDAVSYRHDLRDCVTSEMLPFNQMDEDPGRHELDRLLLSEVLGITESERSDVHEGLGLLRKMLC